jgi:hypothetical protein
MVAAVVVAVVVAGAGAVVAAAGMAPGGTGWDRVALGVLG